MDEQDIEPRALEVLSLPALAGRLRRPSSTRNELEQVAQSSPSGHPGQLSIGAGEPI
jgi:hypothetical protein